MAESLNKPQPSEKSSTSVVVYTEVTPERAKSIIAGNYEPIAETKDFPKRWYAEAVLDRFKPQTLSKLGVSRDQQLFTSPVPYQGEFWQPGKGKVLLELDVNPNGLYVAEAEHISEIITPGFGSVSLRELQQLDAVVRFTDKRITKQEFAIMFNALPQDQQAKLLTMSAGLAKQYWASVVPYADYMRDSLNYAESEILMLPGTAIYSARLATLSKS